MKRVRSCTSTKLIGFRSGVSSQRYNCSFKTRVNRRIREDLSHLIKWPLIFRTRMFRVCLAFKRIRKGKTTLTIQTELMKRAYTPNRSTMSFKRINSNSLMRIRTCGTLSQTKFNFNHHLFKTNLSRRISTGLTNHLNKSKTRKMLIIRAQAKPLKKAN